MIARLLLVFVCGQALGATWFVRPGVWSTVDSGGHPQYTAGVYGSQTGTNYANAWNGLTSIVWGGVSPGDTLYVCGKHIYKFVAGSVPPANALGSSLIGVSGITIRMDYAGDPGVLFGGAFNFYGAGAPYSGPDVNGVYKQVLLSSQTPPSIFYIDSATNIVRLKKRSAITWTDGLGGQFLNGTTNYVQLPDGAVPKTNNTAAENKGFAFDLNAKNNITFIGGTIIAGDPTGFTYGALRHVAPVSPYTVASKNITFNGVTFQDSTEFYLYPGEDNFSFVNCEAKRLISLVYSLINSTATAPQRITVSNCFVHDCGTPEYSDIDNNAVGIQGGDFHLITRNTFSNTGPAIIFWTGGVNMRSNEVSYNVILNSQLAPSSASSAGISISGDNSTASLGKRTGFRVFGNVVVNTAIGTGLAWQGLGITGNLPDYVEIFNNTISGGNRGIDIEVAHAGYAVNARIENNIFNGCAVYDYYLSGTVAATNLVSDFNLHYPCTNSLQCSVINPFQARGTHSVFANPLLASDFHLSTGSPAIGSGDPSISPDIGAYPFAPSGPAPVTPTDLVISKAY